MFYYSVTLTLITLAVLAADRRAELRRSRRCCAQRLNQQFLLGARNQAFLTEYVAGMETVKSLQMEPQLQRALRRLPRELPAGGLQHAPARQHLQRRRQRARAAADARDPVRRRVAGDDRATGFTIGMLVAFQMFAGRLSQPMLHLVGPVAAVPAGRHRGAAAGRRHERAGRAVLARAARARRAGEGRIEVQQSVASATPTNLPYLYGISNLTIERRRSAWR